MILELFFTFLKIGLFSIGGGYAVMPLIQEQVVEEAGWITEKMFTDIITISQMTPGPIAVNTSTFVGLQIAGIGGAVAATFGCVLCGITISLMLHCFFQRHKKSPYVFEVLSGLKSASLGLIISAAVTIVLLALFGTSTINWETFDWGAVAIFSSMLLVMRKWKINPIWLMIISGGIGAVLYV